MKYSKEMSRDLRKIKKPSNDFKVDIIEFDNYIALHVKSSDYNEMQKVKIAEYLNMLYKVINSYGIEARVYGPGFSYGSAQTLLKDDE